MLQNSGKVLDNASPIITSRLAKNIRISVIKTPVLDEDAGVAASIRIVNPRNLSKADFVQSGTATEEMLDFLSACLRYGVSICVAERPPPARPPWRAGSSPPSRTASVSLPLKMALENSSSSGSVTGG